MRKDSVDLSVDDLRRSTDALSHLYKGAIDYLHDPVFTPTDR